ncbi:MAG: hypothetical protein RBU25_09115 [Lentisphaeria bacterium]|nr:hypothetical protein [Lentisphaeria bacterium]
MKNRQKEVAVGRRVGRDYPVLAFLVGVFAGGLLVALLFAVLPSRPPAVARFQAVPAAAPGLAMGETEPASTVWREPLGTIGPVGFEPGGSLVPAPSPPLGASSQWRISGRPCPLLVAGGLLGGCLLGAGAMAWSNRQATARLEARVRRFEDLAAQHPHGEDWLAELDRNLDGEWGDDRR